MARRTKGMKKRQKLCRICRKRPVWYHKGVRLKVCKRCYHKHVWTQRPWVRKARETVPTDALQGRPLAGS